MKKTTVMKTVSPFWGLIRIESRILYPTELLREEEKSDRDFEFMARAEDFEVMAVVRMANGGFQWIANGGEDVNDDLTMLRLGAVAGRTWGCRRPGGKMAGAEFRSKVEVDLCLNL
ncbi:hypothetical protein E3N88_25231 [Mikania micrantha]|uniref:Uncharacterized protein n=1 Tax=Mikania micrantha TaxID=192012 RepID=A0A5N6N5I6_9ASTR|nr:hypothetical protein E3N88_44632 [Mikania micrantha]KAD4385063.1 hypothetical protein E3N88_25231 [Mikania micrantha]